MSFSSVDLTPKNDPFGSKQFQIWCWAPSRVKLASSSKIHANVHVNACMFCIMLCAYCAAGHACLNLSLHWPMLLAPHSLVDNALFIDCMSFFLGHFPVQLHYPVQGYPGGPTLQWGLLILQPHYPVQGYPGGPTFQWGLLILQPHYPVQGYPGGPTFQWGLLTLQPHYPVQGYPGGPTYQWGLHLSSTAALSSAQLPLSSGHGTF